MDVWVCTLPIRDSRDLSRCICTFTLLTNHLAVVKVKLALSLLTCHTTSWQTKRPNLGQNSNHPLLHYSTLLSCFLVVKATCTIYRFQFNFTQNFIYIALTNKLFVQQTENWTILAGLFCSFIIVVIQMVQHFS